MNVRLLASPRRTTATSAAAGNAADDVHLGRYVLIGAHGGAGTTTLLRLLDPQGEGVFTEWRQGEQAPTGRTPLLVARSTPGGMLTAATWVTHWRPGMTRPALVVVADAPFRHPPAVRFRRRALQSQVTAVIDVPYLYRLRYVDDPAEALNDRKVAAAVKRLHRRLADLPLPSVPPVGAP